MRKLRLMAALCVFAVFLSGCWDYRGLDELSIVAGIAIDRNENNPEWYMLSFEIVDPSATINSEKNQTTLVEAEGISLNSAHYQANKKLFDEMYLGNTELMVISEQIAAEEGLYPLMEGHMRNTDIRDNIMVVVSRAPTARELLQPQGNGINISYEINKTLDQNRITSNPTKTMRLYQIYNALKRDTSCIVLPAFRYRDMGDSKIPVMDGLAVFDYDSKLSCYIDEDRVPFFHYMTVGNENVPLTFQLEDGNRIVMSVQKSKQKREFRFEEELLIVDVNIEIDAALLRMDHLGADSRDKTAMALLEQRAAEYVNAEVGRLVSDMQQTGLDPFEISTTIYRRDPGLWSSLKEQWADIYSQAEIRVHTTVELNNTGWMLSY